MALALAVAIERDYGVVSVLSVGEEREPIPSVGKFNAGDLIGTSCLGVPHDQHFAGTGYGRYSC
jgi:hypothetical protein